MWKEEDSFLSRLPTVDGMASKGPAPRPARLRALAKLPPAPRGPVAAAVVVKPPGDLSAAALAVWHDAAPDLICKGVIDAWSADAFGRLCWLRATSSTLRARLDSEGYIVAGRHGGEPVKNPAWTLLRQTDDELIRLEAKFGMLPSDRSRVAAVEATDDRVRLDPARLLS